MDMTGALAMLAALSQETRLTAFRLLVSAGPEGLAAGEIARRLGTPSNTMSTHLGILEQAGLVRSRRAGRSIIYRPELAGARALLLYLIQDCCQGRPEICAPVVDLIETACGCPAAAEPPAA